MFQTRLVEPFVGGGSVFLASESNKVWVNDKDERIFDFWRLVLGDDDESFDRLVIGILGAEPTLEYFDALRSERTGLAAILLNRWSFSGIIGSGPIGGRQQNGKYKIDCRFNAKEIVRRIREIRRIYGGSRVTGTDFADMEVGQGDLVYADPPYFVKGGQLYSECMGVYDHERLASWLKGLSVPWLLSYDDCEFVRDAYSWARIEEIRATYSVSSQRNVRTVELLISRKENP